jgi:hypothetical protein
MQESIHMGKIFSEFVDHTAEHKFSLGQNKQRNSTKTKTKN